MNRIKNELVIASCISTHSEPPFTTLLLHLPMKYSTVEASRKGRVITPVLQRELSWDPVSSASTCPHSPSQEGALRSCSLGNFISLTVVSQQHLTQSKEHWGNKQRNTWRSYMQGAIYFSSILNIFFIFKTHTRVCDKWQSNASFQVKIAQGSRSDLGHHKSWVRILLVSCLMPLDRFPIQQMPAENYWEMLLWIILCQIGDGATFHRDRLYSEGGKVGLR